MRRFGYLKCIFPIILGVMFIFVPSFIILPVIGVGIIVVSLFCITR